MAGVAPLLITILASFLVANSILGLMLWHASERVNREAAAEEARRRMQSGNPAAAVAGGDDGVERANICALPITVHYFINIVGIVLCLGLMMAVTASWGHISNTSASAASLSSAGRTFRWAFTVVLVLTCLALAFAVYGDLSVSWGRRKGVAWAFIATICIFLFAAGVSLIVLNQIHRANREQWVFIGYQTTGALLVICSVVGTLSAFLAPGMGLDVSVVLYEFTLLLAGFCALLFAICGIVVHGSLSIEYQTLMESNLILSFLVCVLFLTSRQVSRVMGQRTLPSGLSIQVLDVKSLSDDQKARWAAAIDRGNGLRHLGAWDGAGAIEMMRAYSRRGVPDIGGLALHMYYPRDGRAPTINMAPSAHAPRDDTVGIVFITVVEVIDLTRFVRPLACLCGRSSLLKWLVVRFGLVGFHWPFTSGVFLANTNPVSVRRDRHQNISQCLRGAIEYNNALPAAHRWSLFLLPAMDTEPVSRCLETHLSGFTSSPLPHTAIVDLRPHKGKTWEQYLHSLKKGNRREYDKRFYKMGGTVHYLDDLRDNDDRAYAPKELDIFYHNKNPYCRPDSHPSFRAGRQMVDAATSPGGSNSSSFSAVADDVQADLLESGGQFGSTSASTSTAGAGASSRRGNQGGEDDRHNSADLDALRGVISAALGRDSSDAYDGEEEEGSHHESKSPSPYSSYAASGTSTPRVGGFQSGNGVDIDGFPESWMVADGRDTIGTVPEKFSKSYPGWNNDCYDLWLRIANLRIANGDSPTLYDLTPQMFADVAAMSKSNRYLMMLRLRNKPIGSSIIFRFPRSRMMTCDMQGLEHESAREARAYFIMLMRSVRLALEQGFDFVDFGPTALGPKTDAGATLFPCRLGLYASDPFLRIATRLSVASFSSFQAQISDANAATASVAQVVVNEGKGDDEDDDQTEPSVTINVVPGVDRSHLPEEIQSTEDIEEIMKMDPKQMTGSQKKRYNKEKKRRSRLSASAGGVGGAGGDDQDADDSTAGLVAVISEQKGATPPNNPPNAKGAPPPNNPPKAKGAPPPNNPSKSKGPPPPNNPPKTKGPPPPNNPPKAKGGARKDPGVELSGAPLPGSSQDNSDLPPV